MYPNKYEATLAKHAGTYQPNLDPWNEVNKSRGHNKVFPTKGQAKHNPNLYCQMYDAFAKGFLYGLMNPNRNPNTMQITGESLSNYESQWK